MCCTAAYPIYPVVLWNASIASWLPPAASVNFLANYFVSNFMPGTNCLQLTFCFAIAAAADCWHFQLSCETPPVALGCPGANMLNSRLSEHRAAYWAVVRVWVFCSVLRRFSQKNVGIRWLQTQLWESLCQRSISPASKLKHLTHMQRYQHRSKHIFAPQPNCAARNRYLHVISWVSFTMDKRFYATLNNIK